MTSLPKQTIFGCLFGTALLFSFVNVSTAQTSGPVKLKRPIDLSIQRDTPIRAKQSKQSEDELN